MAITNQKCILVGWISLFLITMSLTDVFQERSKVAKTLKKNAGYNISRIHNQMTNNEKNIGDGDQQENEECSSTWNTTKHNDSDFCPEFWPLQLNKFGCCDAQIHSLKLSSTCGETQEEQKFRKEGALLLQRKRIFFIGDSVGHHWLNSMLLDANKNNDHNLFPSNQSSWIDFYSDTPNFTDPENYYAYDAKRGFCAFPFRYMNMSSAHAIAPSIINAIYPNLLCPIRGRLHKECCGKIPTIPRSRTGALAVKLNETIPDIVIVQMGLHYHTVPDFQATLQEMLTMLEKYSALNPKTLLLYLESVPQHFDSPSGSYDEFITRTNRSNWICPPLNTTFIQSDLKLGDESTSVGVYNFNRIAKLAVNRTRRIQWLPANSEKIGLRNDAHAHATRCCARHTDCSHYCYSPNLWQPMIDPFYRALNDWFGAGNKIAAT